MDLSLFHDYATSLFLHVTRVGAFFAVVQIFGRQADSVILRLVLAVKDWVSGQPDRSLTRCQCS